MMPIPELSLLDVKVTNRIARVSINHGPINLLDVALCSDFVRLFDYLIDNAEITVVVLESAVPDFFIAHADFDFAIHPETLGEIAPPRDSDGRLNPIQQLTYRLRSLPQLSIAKIAGLARAGGNEMAMACDVRFAVRGKARLSQMETLLGFIPGGGGTAYLSQLVGRARAIEAILSAELLDADTAATWGWVNRAGEAQEIDAAVDELASRAANLPAGVIAALKRAIDEGAGSLIDGLVSESVQLFTLFPSEIAVDRAVRAIAQDLQTPAGEQRHETILRAL